MFIPSIAYYSFLRYTENSQLSHLERPLPSPYSDKLMSQIRIESGHIRPLIIPDFAKTLAGWMEFCSSPDMQFLHEKLMALRAENEEIMEPRQFKEWWGAAKATDFNAFTPSGRFIVRTIEGIIEHSGHIGIDYDADSVQAANDMKSLAMSHKSVSSVKLSASRHGVHLTVAIASPPGCDEAMLARQDAFASAWLAIKSTGADKDARNKDKRAKQRVVRTHFPM